MISGYTIIQLPGFLRACYMTIRRYISDRKEKKKKKTNQIEVEEMHLDQPNTKKHPRVEKAEKLNLKNYLHLKLQLIRNLDELSTIDDKNYVRKSDLREMYIQEIDLLRQVLEKE